MTVIYLDVLFAVNLIINYFLINGCAILTGADKKKWKMRLGAVIGACYSVLVFLPPLSFLLSAICKLVLSAMIAAVSFSCRTVREFFKNLIVFYMVSLGFGGCVLAVFYFGNISQKTGALYSNGIFYFNLPWSVFLLSSAIFYIVLKLCRYLSYKFSSKAHLRKRLCLSLSGNTTELTALLDTGNTLLDPLTLNPVIVTEYKSVAALFDNQIKQVFESNEKNDFPWMLKKLHCCGLHCRIIPYSSVGKTNGFLIGFTPQKAQIRDNCGVRVLNKCTVAISFAPLSRDNSYNALLNPYL